MYCPGDSGVDYCTSISECEFEGVLHTGVSPYGLEGSKNFELYLPHTPKSELPDIEYSLPGFVYSDEQSWNPNEGCKVENIGCFQLYNADKKYKFCSDGNEREIFCEKEVLSVVDLITGIVHSLFCDKAKDLKPEERRLITTPYCKINWKINRRGSFCSFFCLLSFQQKKLLI